MTQEIEQGLAEFEQGLGDLILQAREINSEMNKEMNNSYPTGGLDDKIREWVGKALKLARSVHADSVNITAGFPAGLSVSVTFKSPK